MSKKHEARNWPSDVLGAYRLGSLWRMLSINLYRWGKPRSFVDQPLAPAAGAKPHTASKLQAPNGIGGEDI